MRSILGAERARLRAAGIIPAAVPYRPRVKELPVKSYVLDRRTGEIVSVTTRAAVRLVAGALPVPKPPFVPFSTVDPLTGDRESGYQVRPSGWEQYLKIDPILGTSPKDLQARRRAMAEHIARSPVPQVVQGIASIMTTIDNVQDGAVTLAVAGRLAAKVFPKLIPGVGIISGIADILNLGLFGGLGYLAKLGGPAGLRPAFKMGVPGGHTNSPSKLNVLKPDAEHAGRSTPNTYRKRLAEQIRTGKFRTGWGELFQLLQTSASLVDVGVEIGAAIGYGYELISGLVRGADIELPCWLSIAAAAVADFPRTVFDPTAYAGDEAACAPPVSEIRPFQFKTIGLLGHLDKAFGLPVGSVDQQIGKASEWVIDAGKRVLQGWPIIGLLQDDLSFDEHLSVMWTVHTAQQVMADVVERFDIAPVVNQLYEGASIRAPLVRDRGTWDAIKAVGGNPADPRLPVYGAPREMPYAEFIAEARADWSRAWPAWLAKAPDAESWWFAAQLLNNLFGIQAWALEGPSVQFETAFIREYQAVINMLEARVYFTGAVTQSDIAGRVKRLSEALDPPRITKLPLGDTLALLGISDGGYSAMAGRPIVHPGAT